MFRSVLQIGTDEVRTLEIGQDKGKIVLSIGSNVEGYHLISLDAIEYTTFLVQLKRQAELVFKVKP